MNFLNRKIGSLIYTKFSAMRCHCGGKNENLALVVHGINDIKLEKRPAPTPQDNQVLLQMESVGICGSDVHYIVDGKIGPFVVKKPMILGHEGSGTVIEIGKSVKNLKVGDQVAIEPGVPCRRCGYCREGRYHLCPNIFFCATPPDDGILQRYYAHDADFCFKLPPSMSFDEGAIVEPLACGCRACRRGDVRIGSVVLILGSGPIGLMNLMAAKAMGAEKTLIIDNKNHRLDNAKKLGADYALNVEKMNDKDAVTSIVKQLGDKPSISIDCSGAEICIRIGMLATRTGGKFIILGCGPDEMKLPFMPTALSEIDMLGVFRYVNEYPTAIELIRSKRVAAEKIITHHFKLEDSLEAFEVAKTGKGNPIKIMIHPNPNWKNVAPQTSDTPSIKANICK